MNRATLVELLVGVPVPPETLNDDPALRRLAAVLDDRRASLLDKAAMIRHVLRAQALLFPTQSAEFSCRTGVGWPTVNEFRQVGVRAYSTGDRLRVVADPFRPPWLGDSGTIDAAAAAEPRRRNLAVAGDPFLRQLGLTEYLNTGQYACLQATMTTPAGGTLVIELPTGDGKSLMFQVAAKIGFGDDQGGVTLVIVPTVALALDHERSARSRGFDDRPRAYRAGDQATNVRLRRAILNGSQDLCFAAPEAAIGPLRESLLEAARRGLLRAIVVDEAHLALSWGVEFRPSFQLFAGFRRELIAASPVPPRTLLLSATMTEAVLDVVKVLFATDDNGNETPFEIAAAPRLRPEIDYWVVGQTDPPAREQRVLEAVDLLPRPMIVYTTRVDDAVRLRDLLAERGYRRLGLMTGETPADDRERLINQWSDEQIDVVVATSAFGLGIDYPHTRTIIHACVPETLDRFYQEVGRAGRDGKAAVSLLLPAWPDIKMARGMATPKQISPERGYQRWMAMFQTATYQDGYHQLRLDERPGTDINDIDMVNEKSTAWNARTLNSMALAGVITLGPTSETPEGTPIQAVRVLDPAVNDPVQWKALTAQARKQINQSSRASVDRMVRALDGRCIAQELAALYAMPAVNVVAERACSGCRECQHAPRAGGSWTPVRPAAWPATSLHGTAGLVCYMNQLVIWRGTGSNWSTDDREDVLDLIELLARSGLRSVVLLETGDIARRIEDALVRWPVFVTRSLPVPVRPAGPTLVIARSEDQFDPEWLRPGAAVERIFVVPGDYPDPAWPERPWRTVYAGRALTLESALGRLKS